MTNYPAPKRRSDEIISETMKKTVDHKVAAAVYETLLGVYEGNKDYLFKHRGQPCGNCRALYEPTDDIKDIRCQNCGKHPNLGML